MTITVNSQTTLVFDLDDTLYKEFDFLKSAYLEIAQKCDSENYRYIYAEMLALYRNGADVFGFLQNKFKIDKNSLITIYRNHVPELQLAPEIVKLFTTIKESHAQIAILTDGRSLTQRNKIKALGLEAYCDHIIISEEIGSEKPSVENFRAVEEKCQTSTYYYIADNVKKDFITPKVLGWGTVGLIDNGLNIHVYPDFYNKAEHMPQYLVFELSELNINYVEVS